jgi:hypothetical protein
MYRMPTTPFNEHALWKGQLQISHPKPIVTQNKFLIKRAHHLPSFIDPYIHQNELNYTYKIFSNNYWAGAKQRMAAYREKNALPPEATQADLPVQERVPVPPPVVKKYGRFKWLWFK